MLICCLHIPKISMLKQVLVLQELLVILPDPL